MIRRLRGQAVRVPGQTTKVMKIGSAPVRATFAPQNQHRVIADNFLWLSAAQVAGRVVALFTGIYTRRVLGAVVIGQYSWCLSLLSYFSLLTNPGLETVAKRDVARDPSRAARRFSQLVTLQLALAVSAFGLVAAFFVTGLRGQMVSRLLLLLAIGLLFVPFNLTWLLQARERMAPAAIAQVVAQILTVPALVWLVHKPTHVIRYAVLGYPFQLGMIGFVFWYATRHGLLRWSEVRPSFHGTWLLVREALPLGLSQAAILLYYNFDVILLGLWSGDRVVGLYSTAYNVMLMPTLLSGALSSAYFPQLARVRSNQQQSAKLSSDFLRILVWMGMPLAALGWAFGRSGIVMLYGREFAESGPLLEWLSLNIGLVFFNVGIGNPFDAWGLQLPHFKVGLTGAVLNVALNYMLIPRFGAWAAVTTTLLSEAVVGAGCLWIRNKHVRIPWWTIAARPLLFCVTAALLGRYLAFKFPDQWFLSLILVACAISAAFWLSERNAVVSLLRGLRNVAERHGTT